ncbi:syntaxin-4-like [Anopheles ziemanni]|uniref:syntaxin-4-like n=1 Tax=Anopheles coustani TaxID=139045 RepID=UPI00265AB0E5|nr:syntaxin-4-like [Anopheles coustani]XP_058172656.1 syntaxin-4-like [Anopheles ziemanni]
MVKDRLAELRSKSKYANHNLDDELEANARLSKSQEEIFENLAKFSELTAWIQTIRRNTREMRKLIASSTFHYNDKVIRDNVEENLKESNGLCQRIYGTIKKLEVELEDDSRRTGVLFRIKHTQFIVIKDDYLSAYREHEEFVCYYEDRIKDLMKLEAKAMNYNITDDEAMEKLTSNQMSPFVGNILEETERERQKLRDIMTRHGQLEALEKSLVEIRDMFVRISSMVMEQGSLVQVIEYHAQQATLNTDHGAHQLQKAREYKIKALKKRTCILIWVSTILAVLLILLIVF